MRIGFALPSICFFSSSHYILHLSCAQQRPLSFQYVAIGWLPHREASAMPGLVLAFNHEKLQQLAAAKRWLPADLQCCKMLHLIL